MQRLVLGLLLPLLAACAGKNTVAGDEKTKSEQLEESVPNWCAKACVKIESCAKQRPCDCSGDVCDCAGGAGYDCPSSCQQAMNEFMNKGETCAGAGLHFQSCIDAASCNELYTDGACYPTDPAEKVCFPKDSAATPTDSGSSVGYAGSASIDSGPSSGGASAYGGASAGAFGGSVASGGTTGEGGAAAEAVYCSSGFSTGAAPGNTTNEICEGGELDCNDGHEYRYLCAHTSDGRSACSCFVDDKVTTAFDPMGECPSRPALYAGCGWNIEF
jgi:hypothetical protein